MVAPVACLSTVFVSPAAETKVVGNTVIAVCFAVGARVRVRVATVPVPVTGVAAGEIPNANVIFPLVLSIVFNKTSELGKNVPGAISIAAIAAGS